MDAISLCPSCNHCPEVVLDGDRVRIGEDSNTTVLKKEERDVLVDLPAITFDI
jgi:hypothetical protein